MIVKILGMVFLFIICVRFPKGKLIADIIWSKYGEAFVRKIHIFEKNNYKLWKGHLDLRLCTGTEKN